jgi:tRNA dimethylallyltransferase
VSDRRFGAELAGSLPSLIVVGGATATGKTGLSLRLADDLIERGIPVEIVSADSRQVYRGMDIGTAKVSPDNRARVIHHGLDLVEPDEPFSLAQFRAHALDALRGLAVRHGIGIVVGGTGLYLRAIARGIDTERLPTDPELRARLEDDLARDGLDALLARLDALAPGIAANVDRRNPRRVVRALELAMLRGDRPLPAPIGYPAPVLWLGLTVDREVHRRWIEDRAAGQFDGGLLDEAKALLDRYPESLRAFSAIGYPETFAVLEGRLERDAALVATVNRTNAFARRQRTWFRSEPDVTWLDATDDPLPAASALVEPFLAADRA